MRRISMAWPILSAVASCATAGLLPLALAACATPTYPTQLSGGTRPAATPGAVVAPAPSSPELSDTSSTAAVASPPIVSVESAPLPPASTSSASPPPSSPSSALATSPAQSAISPNYTPPPAAIVEPGPIVAPPAPIAITPPRTAPPPVAARTAVRYRQAPGRVIAGGRVVAAVGMYRDYVVQPHDHVDAIARDLQTSRKVLVDANHLQAPFSLQPGQHLKVPVAKAYEVEAGDTIAAVATRFSVPVGELAELNDLSERARLRSGDKLALPDRFEDRGPTRLPPVMVAERAPRTYPPARIRTYATTGGGAVRPATYSASPMNEPQVHGGPYVPSPAALAAAQRLAVTRSYGPPSYGSGRASPNARIAAAPYRPPSYQASGAASPPTPSQMAVAALGRGRFIWPVRGAILSPFGVEGVGRRNDGIDIRSPQGSPVLVAAAGEVVYAGDQIPGFGNLVLVKHPGGWVTAYAHLASIGVQMKQNVSQGQMLGGVGATGTVGEAQLHFEVRYASTPAEKARPIDPLLVLPR